MKQIQEKLNFIDIDNQEYDPVIKTGIPGLTIAKNEAKTELAALWKAYEARVGAVCARVFCVGGTPKAIAEMKLAAEQQAVVVTANTLFEMIADKMLPHCSNPKRFTVMASMVMREELAKAYLRYCPDSQLPGVEQQFFDSGIGEDIVEARAALATIVARSARLSASRPLAVMYAQEIAVKTAVDLKVTDEPMAIVVLGLTPEDVPEFEANFFAGRPSEVVNIENGKNIEALLKAAGKRLEKKMADDKSAAEDETPAA